MMAPAAVAGSRPFETALLKLHCRKENFFYFSARMSIKRVHKPSLLLRSITQSQNLSLADYIRKNQYTGEIWAIKVYSCLHFYTHSKHLRAISFDGRICNEKQAQVYLSYKTWPAKSGTRQ